ncbi:MAG: ABC transporter ATP-binding protein [Anaerolineae bacterium]|nr:MAG: ABC transporter ATP-binding protein [Anaerolineae bacterium]
MALLSAHNLAKSYPPVEIFSGLSLSIPHGARIALVGPNGIGKTTLLRVLAGEELPSAGEVHYARGLTIGYLPQESVLESRATLWEECLRPFAELQTMEAEMERLAEAISRNADDANALERYGALQARFEQAGGYEYTVRIRQVLAGLGFSEEEYDLPLQHLSGGQRTRALLARLLLERPQLLALDEPTNHLDVAAIEWLEGTLREWDGAVLVVSHDRYFLDRVCNRVWEMSAVGFETYRGNYSHYVQQREARWERRAKTFAAAKQRLEKDLEYIRRNIAGQNVNQAKGRLRRLSRQLQAIEQVGLEAVQGQAWSRLAAEVDTSTSMMSVEEAHRRIQALALKTADQRPLHLELRPARRSGEKVLRTRGLVVGYPGRTLFRVPDLELHRLECVALIGPNGAGKTTFLKTLLGQLPPLAGDVVLGAGLEIGYFAQAHEDLSPERTLMEEIESVAPHMLPAQIRHYLARYLFRGEEVFKPVSVLSGGERGRLALAKLALSGANLLLLDEPTNHLDIPSQEVLQAVLADFEGTVILVSHDRYLIDALASQVWAVTPGREWLEVFPGSYSEFRAAQEQRPAEAAGAFSERHARQRYAQQRAAKNRAQAAERRRQARIAAIEARVEELETLLADLGERLAAPPDDPAEVQRLGDEYVEAENELNALLAEWEQLHE